MERLKLQNIPKDMDWLIELVEADENGDFDVSKINIKDVKEIQIDNRPIVERVNEDGSPLNSIEYFNKVRQSIYGLVDKTINKKQKEVFKRYLNDLLLTMTKEEAREQVFNDIDYFFNNIAKNMRSHHIGVFLSPVVQDQIRGER